MRADQYQQAYAVFLQVVNLRGAERQTALDMACGQDGEVRTWVEQLLDDESSLFEGTIEDVSNAPSATEISIRPGDQLNGRFEVIDKLGAGGMAEVWKVRHLRLHTRYALKILTHTHPALQLRFMEEGRMQARIRHHNIVRIFDVIHVQDQPALVMELMEGADLERFLQQNPPSMSQLDALAGDILRGVQIIHDTQLIHRDLKPSNILLSGEGDQLTAKIADFGIARNLTFSEDSRMTLQGAFMGTLAYMAPELLRGARNADVRSDIWALGCILYRMIVGREAFLGGEYLEMLVRISAGQHAPLPSHLPLRWREAISIALQPEPANRPQNCQELRQLLALPETLNGRRPLPRSASVPATRSSPSTLTSLHSQYAPNNLPSTCDQFFGRQPDLDTIQRHLHQGERLITVLGTAGLGKSRLALEVGRQMNGAWPGGVWFVELADARSLGGIFAVMGEVLGIALGRNPQQHIREALAQRGRALLILDNFEQINHLATQTIGQWLDTAPTVSFLVTSRTPLGLGGEVVYALDLLEESHAVALFVDRAQRARRRDHLLERFEDEIRTLVNRLDRLPLAIELAAARSRLYTPAQLENRLSRRFDLLRIRSGDLPERQRTLRAALQWSWDMLDEVEQSVLSQCAAFEGGMTLEAADEVIKVEDDGVWVEEVLAELVDKSLLVSTENALGESRLTLLVSVQAFAAEKLTDPQPLYRRHARRFAQLGASPYDPSVFKEIDNLIIAARRAAALGEIAAVVSCASVVGKYFVQRGPVATGVEFFESLLEILSPTAPPISLLTEFSLLLFNAGFSKRAETQLRRALERSREVQDEREGLRALVTLTHLFYQQGQHAQALSILEDMVKHPVVSAYVDLELQVRNGLGLVLGCVGRAEEALTHQRRVLVLVREEKMGEIEISALNNICITYQLLGDQQRAIETLQEALAMARALEVIGRQSPILNNLASIYTGLGRLEEAQEAITEALRLTRKLGRPRNEITQLNVLANLHIRTGDDDEALASLEAGMALIEETRFRKMAASMLENMGVIFLLRGDLVEAERFFYRALEEARRNTDIMTEADIYLNLGQIALRRQQFDEAQRQFNVAGEIYQGKSNALFRAFIQLNKGELDYLRGELEKAHAALDEAESLYRSFRRIPALVRTMISRSRVYRDAHDFRAARQILREAKTLLPSPRDRLHQEIDALLAMPDATSES